MHHNKHSRMCTACNVPWQGALPRSKLLTVRMPMISTYLLTSAPLVTMLVILRLQSWLVFYWITCFMVVYIWISFPHRDGGVGSNGGIFNSRKKWPSRLYLSKGTTLAYTVKLVTYNTYLACDICIKFTAEWMRWTFKWNTPQQMMREPCSKFLNTCTTLVSDESLLSDYTYTDARCVTKCGDYFPLQHPRCQTEKRVST